MVALLWGRCPPTAPRPGAGTAAGLSHASKASDSGVVMGCSGGHLTWGRGSIRSRACRAWSCPAAASSDPAVLGPPRTGSLPLRRRCTWWAGSAKTVASHGTAAATTCACPALHRSDASAQRGCRLDWGTFPAAAGAQGCKGLLAQVVCSQTLIRGTHICFKRSHLQAALLCLAHSGETPAAHRGIGKGWVPACAGLHNVTVDSSAQARQSQLSTGVLQLKVQIRVRPGPSASVQPLCVKQRT